jgi:ribosomal protein L34E
MSDHEPCACTRCGRLHAVVADARGPVGEVIAVYVPRRDGRATCPQCGEPLSAEVVREIAHLMGVDLEAGQPARLQPVLF